MGLRRFLKENRGMYLDHRHEPPTGPGIAIDADLRTAGGALGSPLLGGGDTRRRRRGSPPDRVRYRQVQPAFTPTALSDPLPYEEPWERAMR